MRWRLAVLIAATAFVSYISLTRHYYVLEVLMAAIDIFVVSVTIRYRREIRAQLAEKRRIRKARRKLRGKS